MDGVLNGWSAQSSVVLSIVMIIVVCVLFRVLTRQVSPQSCQRGQRDRSTYLASLSVLSVCDGTAMLTVLLIAGSFGSTFKLLAGITIRQP
jgi:hypothetical protein